MELGFEVEERIFDKGLIDSEYVNRFIKYRFISQLIYYDCVTVEILFNIGGFIWGTRKVDDDWLLMLRNQ